MSGRKLLNLMLVLAMVLGLVPLAARPVKVAAAPAANMPVPPAPVPEIPDVELLNLPVENAPLPASLKLLDEGLRQATGPVQVIIELNDEPATVTYANVKAINADLAVELTRAQIAKIEAAQQKLLPSLKALDATVLYRTQRVYNGIAVVVDAKQLPELAKLPGVKGIHRLIPKELENWSSVPQIGAADLWEYVGAMGEDIKVGVIDTGIDYLHTDFGGPGTAEAYAANDTTVITDTYLGNPLFPTAKVVGGIDLVGNAYDARDPYSIPMPDPDPMDCNGHGSHVAGTIAGYGVNADGTTYTGPYNTGINFAGMLIGPGVAPKADLYAIRVFGCAGSTNVTDLALEWAVDPDGDGDFSDRMDVVNMSLGSSYGSTYDSSAIASNNAALAGVIVVASAGNSGDVYYVTGSPAAADRAISVAASEDGGAVFGSVKVNSPAGIAGLYPASEAAFGPDLAEVGPLTGDLAYPAQKLGCNPFDASDAAKITGKIALLDRGTCAFVVKVKNAQDAGAIGVLVVNSVAGFPFTMGGTDPTITIPSMMTDLNSGATIKAALAGGETVNVTFDAAYRDTQHLFNPALEDTLGSFSSRGPRRTDSFLKPDITAPGVSIYSVQNGSGTRGVSMQGTSMAAPHVTGAMALLRELRPGWTVEELKALAMNTANNELWYGSIPYGPGRVGAGRITLEQAVESPVVAYNAGKPGTVSVSFGAWEGATPTTLKRTIRVVNKSSETLTYTVTLDLRVDSPGMAYTFSPASITLPPYGAKNVEVTLTLTPADMRRTTRDATVSGGRHWLPEETGYVVLTDAGATYPDVRVPVYATARPVSAMSANGTLAFPGTTGTATIALTGSGLNTGGAYGTTDYLSLGAAFELMEESPEDPFVPAEAKNADIKYLGVTNNYGTSGIASALYFALATYGKHTSATAYDTEFDIYIDADRDGYADYVVYNYTLNPPSDVFVTYVVDLETGVATASSYTNGFSASSYDTKIYNSDVMILPVAVSLMPKLNRYNPRFDFYVVSFAREYDGVVDVSNIHTYSVGAQGLKIGTGSPFFPDLPGSSFQVTYNQNAYMANETQGLLVVHLHNANGATAEVLPVTTASDLVSFTVLHTNDFHGQLELSGSNPGIARVANTILNVRTVVDPANVLLLDAGDEMQGSLLSNINKGKPVIDLFNLLGYNAATFGNHEFDWGQDILQERVSEATYPYLVANLTLKNDAGACTDEIPDYVQPWALFEVGSGAATAKVGVIGVTTQETPFITVAQATAGLCFNDPAEAVIKYYDEVKAAGADVIIVLSHLGYTDGGYGYGFPVYGDQTLAKKLNDAGKPVNLIIGGHSHTDLTAPTLVGNTYVVQAHYNGRKVGRADFVVNKTTGAVTITWTRLVVGTSDLEEPTAKDRVAEWVNHPDYQALINEPIGFSNVDLVRNYNGDSLMGKFIQDAIYNQINSDEEPGNDADIVFNNPGGIRADLTSATKPFTLTYGMLFSVLPFGNQTVVGDMTGAQIMELLNQSATLFKGAIQVAGLKYKFYRYNNSMAGQQPWAWGAFDVEVFDKETQTWVPLEADKVYRVATNEFLAPAGQDGFLAFKYMTNLSYWGDMLNIVNAWVKSAYGTPETAYNEGLDGRITRVGDDTGGPVIPVTILHNNDSHGYFANYYKLATAVKLERAKNPDRTLLLNAGDQIQGDSMMYYFKSAGLGYAADGTELTEELQINPMIKLMNAMGYDAMTLGNHEFNFGHEVFTSTFKAAEFPILQANIYDDGRYGLAEVPVQPHALFELPGTTPTDTIKIAVLGIGNHRIPNYELPSNIPGLTFTNPITETQARAPQLKATNDAVIALTHIGFTENPASVEVDTNVDTELAKQTTGVDAIIGGHSHTYPDTGFLPYKYLPTFIPNAEGTPVLVTQAGRRNQYLGQVVLGFMPKEEGGYELISKAGRYISTSSLTPDPDAQAVGAPYEALLAAYNNKAIGQTAVPLNALNAFTEETNAANLQADASVWKLAQAGITVDFHLSGAMTNAKIADTATPTTPVTLTVANMFSLMPYENSLVVMRMNGPQLKRVLERAYRNYYYYKNFSDAGGYSKYTTCMLDINSVGKITYYDTTALPNGFNVKSLEINGEPVDFGDANTYYLVSTVNYLAAGSCNFNDNGVSLWPLDQIEYDTQYYVRDAVIEYIQAQEGPIAPAIEGRLTFVPTVLKTFYLPMVVYNATVEP